MLVFYSPYAGVQTTSTVQRRTDYKYRLQVQSKGYRVPEQYYRGPSRNLEIIFLSSVKKKLEIATNRVAKATNFCD